MCDLDDLKEFGTREAQVTTGAQVQSVQRILDSSLWGSLEALSLTDSEGIADNEFCSSGTKIMGVYAA